MFHTMATVKAILASFPTFEATKTSHLSGGFFVAGCASSRQASSFVEQHQHSSSVAYGTNSSQSLRPPTLCVQEPVADRL